MESKTLVLAGEFPNLKIWTPKNDKVFNYMIIKKNSRILGIETSCDETGVAVYDSEQGLLGHALYSQVVLHAKYGGVVPELASRDHIRKLIPLIKTLFKENDISAESITGVAYTAGPGLIGALLVGASVAHSLAWAWQIPAIGVHHMEAHLLAPMLEKPAPTFPFLALLVSGGHTQLVKVTTMGKYTILGESIDDAAGEAFDKTAKLLGLAYPGGPALAKLAEQGHPDVFHFPRPMIHKAGLDFSFSGLKTAVLTCWRAQKNPSEQTRADIAHAFEEAVIDTLLIKCRRAIEETALNQFVIAGGVSANRNLRTRLKELAQTLSISVYYPRLEFCTDNGAMIAYTGYQRLLSGHSESLAFPVYPRWSLDNIND